jgi:hypothetical protein
MSNSLITQVMVVAHFLSSNLIYALNLLNFASGFARGTNIIDFKTLETTKIQKN